MTSSQKLREEGNNIYKTLDESIAPVLIESRLLKCFNLYNQSISCACNYDDLSSAHKNLSVVSLKLSKIYQLNDSKKKVAYYNEQVQFSSRLAIEYGQTSKSQEWLTLVCYQAFDGLNTYIDYLLANFNEEERIQLLLKLINYSSKFIISSIYYHVANINYKHSIKLMEANLNQSVKAINECNYYYEECKSLVNRENVELKKRPRPEFYLNLDDLNELNANKITQHCVIEGLKHKRIADKLIDDSLNKSERLNVEFVWDAIDLYRDAIVKTKDKDLELEAEILSKIGMIYKDILKMKDQAKQCFYSCFNLTESMKPKLFTNCSWYIRCTRAIKMFQDENVKQEEKEKEDELQTVIGEISADLEKIKSEANKNDNVSFLKFIYKTYPPKKKLANFDENLLNTKDEKKKAFKNALANYHSDKNSEFGKAWYFISLEICKHFSRFYEELK